MIKNRETFVRKSLTILQRNESMIGLVLQAVETLVWLLIFSFCVLINNTDVDSVYDQAIIFYSLYAFPSSVNDFPFQAYPFLYLRVFDAFFPHRL